MSDLDQTKKTNFSQKQNTGSSQKLKDQVADAGAEVKQRAGDALSASVDISRDKFKDAADAAKDVASGTADRFEEQAHEKQRSAPISSSDLLATSATRPTPSRTTHLSLPAASIPPPNMSRMPPRKSATGASETSSTMRPISRNASRSHSLGSRCSQALRQCAS
jgi:hypothetical protein